ncbi:hypothetical protein RP20_CCG018972 [Aedes albopictus]|nr:hypothetical protein RP20_CCG018972 [Aedes albopictus]
MVGSRVYVGGLPHGVRERDLERFFKGYGRTRDILIKNGYGFVEFEDYRDADDAVYELNGKDILGESDIMVGSRVYVGGLPHGVRERDLERFFKGYGRTRDILIKNGYGFVEFEDYRDADDAVYELNGKDILGERVTVEPARGTARGGGSRRDHDRYDRYDRRGGGGGRYDKNRSNSRNSSRYGPPLRTEYRLTVENLSSRVSWQIVLVWCVRVAPVSGGISDAFADWFIWILSPDSLPNSLRRQSRSDKDLPKAKDGRSNAILAGHQASEQMRQLI